MTAEFNPMSLGFQRIRAFVVSLTLAFIGLTADVPSALAAICDASPKPRLVCKIGQDCSLENNYAWELCNARLLKEPIITNLSHTMIDATSKLAPSGTTQPQPGPKTPQETIFETALAILKEFADKPLDLATQDKARDIIKKCEGKKTLSEMQECSGFVVPPQILQNCLHGGACIPLPPAHLNADLLRKKDWGAWQAYNNNIERKTEAFVRPWVTTNKQAKACKAKSTDTKGALSEERFAYCMAQVMGGPQSKKAIACYAKYPGSPPDFGACLSSISLTADQRRIAQCATQLSLEGKADLTGCVGGKVQDLSKQALTCAQESKGEPYLFGHCLSGYKAVQRKENIAIKTCVSATADPKSGKLIGQCLKAAANSSDVKKIEKAIDLGNCVRDAGDVNKKLKCVAPELPPQTQIPLCALQANDALEAAQCTGNKDVERITFAKQCIDEAKGDKVQIGICVGGIQSLNKDQLQAVACAKNSKSTNELATCVASKYLPKDAALAINCAQSGSPAAFAVCMAGPEMNAELRIASECLASTGGEPVSFVGCAGGRLTMKELQQCIAGNFKSENGCFGENNEIVKALREQEKMLRGVLKAVGLEIAYNNMLNDLKNGKLGENNEIVRIYRTLNTVLLEEPAKAAENIAREAERAGQQIVGGVTHLAQEIARVFPQVKVDLPKVVIPVPSLPPLPQLPNAPTWESPNINIGGWKPRLW